MNKCSRCGIDIEFTGWCDDCSDVEQVPRVARAIVDFSRVKVDVHGVIVRSARRGHLLDAEKRALVDRFRLLNRAGSSANEIALELGVHTRTVSRWRVKYGEPACTRAAVDYHGLMEVMG